MENLKKIIERWHILKKAPWEFWLVVVLVFATGIGLQEYRYSGLRESENVLKHRIDGKDDELKIANRQLEQRKSEFEFVEKERDRYKNIALGILEKNTYYIQMTNEELKTRAVNIANKLREITRISLEKTEKIFSKYLKESKETSDGEKKKQLDDKHKADYTDMMANFLGEYNKNIKAEAVNLRNELLLRLPLEAIEERKKVLGSDRFFYENPTNFTGAEAVATDLEKLAISLPNK